MGISRLFLKEFLEICIFSKDTNIKKNETAKILFLGDQSIRVNTNQINNAAKFLKSKKNKNLYLFDRLRKATLHDFFPTDIRSKLIIKTLDINGKPDLNVDITRKKSLNESGLLIGSISHFIDIGTLEHVINPYKALCNISDLIKKGGLISHLSPCSSYLNHGYYCISPQLLHDFYLSKGFKILRFRTLSYIGNYDTKYSLCFNLNYNHDVEMKGLKSTLRGRHFKDFLDSLLRRVFLRLCRETYISFTAIKLPTNTKSNFTLYQKQYE
tara:strand:+ start:41 stop:847 length:807 start_codon:yes stop_codon:yes gene_type:complete